MKSETRRIRSSVEAIALHLCNSLLMLHKSSGSIRTKAGQSHDLHAIENTQF